MGPLPQFGFPRDDDHSHKEFSSDEEYSIALDEQASLMGQKPGKWLQTRSRTDIVRSILVLLLLGSSIILVTIMAVRQAFPGLPMAMLGSSVSLDMSNQPEILKQPCGQSPAEARERGCKFDNILFAWVHPRCYDEDLCKSFRDVKFHFSLDGNNTSPISQDEAYKGDYPTLFVNWEYHVTHCTWAWMKMHRAILGAGRSSLDGVASDYQHTSHCETMLLRRQYVEYDAMNTVVSIKYPDCGA